MNASLRIVLSTGILMAAFGASPSAAASPASAGPGAPELRVCADPEALPFSDRAGEGFENRIAALIAGELGERVAYSWVEASRESLDQALAAGACDVVMGVPRQLGSVETTDPYYTSSYVFVSRADRGLDITSIKDHRLKSLRVGVEGVGSGGIATPPARALAERGLGDRLVAYRVPQDRAGRDVRAGIIEAVARGEIDLAAVWGPPGGYFAARAAVPLTVLPVADTEEFSARKEHFELAAFQYEICMAVRKGDHALRDRLNRAIARRQPEIDRVLARFRVPLVEPDGLGSQASLAPSR